MGQWLEYSVVVVSLAVTLGVGLHFSRSGKSSLQEYMLGGKQMTVLPICLSVAATILTGSSMVSTSQEVYLYGLQASLPSWLWPVIGGTIACWVCLPISYNIKSASLFEFFDRRFHPNLRTFASVMYALDTIQHTAMAQFVPAVSLSQATGLPVFPIACVMSLLCVTYTATGGLKAVAWADSFQTLCFTVCALVLLVFGISEVGGIGAVIEKGSNGSRMEHFNMDSSPYVRHTVPISLVASVLYTVPQYLSPSYHQRLASLPTMQQARRVIFWSSIFIALFSCLTNLTGLVVYAYFAGCDPVLDKRGIRSYSTILPYFVKQISKRLPGIEGIFQAGMLAAGLSTTTSCWNTAACTIHEDLILPLWGREISKKASFRILMSLVVGVGVVSTSFILVIQNVESVLEATVVLKGIFFSVNVVLYVGGLFLPWINTKGIVAGSLTSFALSMFLSVGSQRAKKNKLVVDLPKILTTAECLVNGTSYRELNMTTAIGTTAYGIGKYADPSVPWYFRLSFFGMYTVPGILLGLIIACLASLVTGFQDLATVDRQMIAPQMRWVLPRKPSDVAMRKYSQVPQADGDGDGSGLIK